MKSNPNRSLPPRVRREKGRGVFFRDYYGRVNGKVQHGPRIRLADYDAPMSVIWQAWERLQTKKVHTVGWMLDVYYKSDAYLSLKPRTQSDYQSLGRLLGSAQMLDGKTFSDLLLSAITKRTIRKYLDHYPHKSSANRQISFLKAAWNWTEERYDIPPNPCNGVKLNKEKPRDRYVTHQEFEEALSLAPEWLSIAMELSYWCRARRGEVLAMRFSDVSEEGLFVDREKGSQSEITDAPRIRELVERSRHLQGTTDYLVRNKKGQIGTSAFDSAWRRLSKQHSNPFPFHDIKAKGLSDMKGEPWAGHKSKRMLDVYVRRPRKIMPEYD